SLASGSPGFTTVISLRVRKSPLFKSSRSPCPSREPSSGPWQRKHASERIGSTSRRKSTASAAAAGISGRAHQPRRAKFRRGDTARKFCRAHPRAKQNRNEQSSRAAAPWFVATRRGLGAGGRGNRRGTITVAGLGNHLDPRAQRATDRLERGDEFAE